jgi:hypothetical protein
MPTRQYADYQAALKALAEAKVKAQRILTEVRAARGERPEGISNWQSTVPTIDGQPIQGAEVMLGGSTIDVAGWPKAQELCEVINQWHRATIVRDNAWRLVPAEEKKWAGHGLPPPP